MTSVPMLVCWSAARTTIAGPLIRSGPGTAGPEPLFRTSDPPFTSVVPVYELAEGPANVRDDEPLLLIPKPPLIDPVTVTGTELLMTRSCWRTSGPLMASDPPA